MATRQPANPQAFPQSLHSVIDRMGRTRGARCHLSRGAA